MTTSTDIRHQVQQAADASEGNYDVAAITRAIVNNCGLVDVDTLAHNEFWALVAEHDND